MSPDVVILVFLSQVAPTKVLLLLKGWLVLFSVVLGVKWLLEEAHLRPSSLYVLVDFVKGLLVTEVVVPYGKLALANLALSWSVIHLLLRPYLIDLLLLVFFSCRLEISGKLHLVLVLHTNLVAGND